ncbi:MAG: M48 family metallopeptidase [Oscillospiraceae bacterium]
MLNKIENRLVKVDEQTINYILIRKNIKNINLRVKEDGEVVVSCNYKTKLNLIDGFIKEKIQFILKAKNHFILNEKIDISLNYNYMNNEKIFILGKEFCLSIIKGDKNIAFIDENTLYIQCKDVDNIDLKKKTLQILLTDISTDVFSRLSKDAYSNLKSYNIKMPQIKSRFMKSKWGSCMPYKNVITLNTKMIALDESLIFYVIMHEFSHLVYCDHSKNFYYLFYSFIDDYKAKKIEFTKYKI